MFLESCGEILPLACSDGEFCLFNVTTVIDALNEEESDVEYLSNGKPLTIKRASFETSKLVDIDIFRLPQFPYGNIYVSERFIERTRSAGLLGLIVERA
jgi:hypothetical protein